MAPSARLPLLPRKFSPFDKQAVCLEFVGSSRSLKDFAVRMITQYLDDELNNLIYNHRQRKAFDRPVYAHAIEEWHRRHGGHLNLQISVDFIHAAAAERRFVSYGELAQANGCDWEQVRYPMNAHLWAIVDVAHRRG